MKVALHRRGRLVPYYLLMPSLLLIGLLLLYPFVYSLFVSLTDMNLGRLRWSFVGFENFVQLFSGDSTFYLSVALTLIFVGASVFFEIVIGMLMALALNRSHVLSGPTRALLIVPWALPGTVVAGLWRFIYLPQYGLFDSLATTLGFGGHVAWLGPKLALFSVIVSEIWRMSPFVALLLLAGLSTMPDSVYDAAKIDGAHRWTIFWRMTVPMMKPVLSLVIVLRTLFCFQTIESVYVLTRGGPGFSTLISPYLIYETVFSQLRAGYGAAIAYIVSFLAIGICGAYLLAVRERARKVVLP